MRLSTIKNKLSYCVCVCVCVIHTCWWFIYFIHTKIKIKKSIDRLLSWRHWNSKNKKMITMCVTDRIFVCVCVWTTFLFFSISFWLMIDWFLSLFSFTLDYLFCFFFCPLPTTHRHTQWNYRLNELRDFSFCCFNSVFDCLFSSFSLFFPAKQTNKHHVFFVLSFWMKKKTHRHAHTIELYNERVNTIKLKTD